MLKKIFTNTYLLAVILFIIALSVPGSGGALLALVSILLLIISIIRSICKRVRKKGPAPAAVEATAVEAAPQPEAQPEQKPVQKPTVINETHRVAGTSYRRDAIKKLGVRNSEYDELTASDAADVYEIGDRIYEYDFYGGTPALIPEPDNPYDSKAIRVEVDGQHIGYIKHGSNTRVRNLMASGRIISIDVELYGGRYKQLDETDDERPRFEKGEYEYGAKLIFHLKPE